jgi:membrane protein
MLKKNPYYQRLVKYWFRLIRYSKSITFPGLDKVPVYDVLLFFYHGLTRGSLTTRASAVAFNFYLALFPAIIFIFTLIPYIPIDNFQKNMLDLIENLLPSMAFLSLQDTITDIITIQRGSWLSLGFVAALFFSTNGFNSLIDAFNATYHSMEGRSWLAQRLISLLMVIIIFTLTITSVLLIMFGEIISNYLIETDWIKDSVWLLMFDLSRWLIIVALFFFAISFLYYLAPTAKSRYRFISPGSTLATVLCVIISLAFSFYINHFNSYNTLYGSIGTILIILMWLYFNAFGLLIGFELNVSIGMHRKK